ncbi:hypothetical protein Q0F99_09415 [Rathayibacter oskolensis]|nr:hypothetical protein [Rathayibacter oskolensis]WKK73040.1 hypothetical protein Q0F99_09415 [Rathayibacter oskolensis]
MLTAALGLAPGGETLVVAPISPALAGPIRVHGIRHRGSVVPIDWDGAV